MLLLCLLSLSFAAESFAGFGYYLGDPHAHTGLSHDGQSSDIGDGCYDGEDCRAFADVFATAEANGLDWLVLSDHANGSTDYAATDDEYAQLVAANVAYSGSMVVVPGAEVWFTVGGERVGHKNVMLFGDMAGLASLVRTDLVPPVDSSGWIADCATIESWMDGLTALYGHAVLVPHHTIVDRPMPTDWTCRSATYEVATEIYSTWGNSLGAPRSYDTPATVVPSGSVHAALDPDGLGLEFGFIGGTDGHLTRPGDLCQEPRGRDVVSGGLTVAVVPESDVFDSEALYQAIVDRRTLVTTGPLSPVDLEWASGGSTWGLGEAVAFSAGDDLVATVTVADPTAVTAAYVVTPHAEYEMAFDGLDTFTLTLDGDIAPAWAYVSVHFDGVILGDCDDGNGNDDEWIWLSPSWFTPVDHDDDGDGLSHMDGDCDDADPLVGLGEPEIVGDGLDQDCDDLDLCYADDDGDGYTDGTTFVGEIDCWGGLTNTGDAGDCDDQNAAANPGAGEEVGDGFDGNCDGVEYCFVDADGDNFRTTARTASSTADCESTGVASLSETIDCDDTNGAINDAATELPGDEVDSNCDDTEVCFTDTDGDGYRADRTIASEDADCTDVGEALLAAVSGDCDDDDAAFNPTAAEEDCTDPLDYNCDAVVLYADDDLDTWPACIECDDADSTVNPGAAEVVGDNVDQDCDALELCFADADEDGWRSDDELASADADCDDVGEALLDDVSGDCHDLDPTVSPGGVEAVSDGVDSDCDGLELCYTDADGDGWRDESLTMSAFLDCSGAGEASASTPLGDCDPDDATVFPAAPEVVGDGVDQDCDGGELCYADEDGDGWRTAVTVVSADADCDDPGEALFVISEGDCDDTDPSTFPFATEGIGDGHDSDCDGGELCLLDADSDGFWSSVTEVVASADADCDDARELGQDDPGEDCRPLDGAVHPGAAEGDCTDPTDYNCDGSVGYADTDRDRYPACRDCDDGDPARHPSADERAGDEVDQDCDLAEICFADDDGDGFHTGEEVASTDTWCDGEGEASVRDRNGDCDDRDAAVHPGATEIVADEVDQDCDGTEICLTDGDADGYRRDETTQTVSEDVDCDDPPEWGLEHAAVDCDDADPSVGPCEPEDTGEDTGHDSGELPEPEPETRCGCTSEGSAGALLVFGLSLGLRGWRRRR